MSRRVSEGYSLPPHSSEASGIFPTTDVCVAFVATVHAQARDSLRASRLLKAPKHALILTSTSIALRRCKAWVSSTMTVVAGRIRPHPVSALDKNVGAIWLIALPNGISRTSLAARYVVILPRIVSEVRDGSQVPSRREFGQLSQAEVIRRSGLAKMEDQFAKRKSIRLSKERCPSLG